MGVELSLQNDPRVSDELREKLSSALRENAVYVDLSKVMHADGGWEYKPDERYLALFLDARFRDGLYEPVKSLERAEKDHIKLMTEALAGGLDVKYVPGHWTMVLDLVEQTATRLIYPQVSMDTARNQLV